MAAAARLLENDSHRERKQTMELPAIVSPRSAVASRQATLSLKELPEFVDSDAVDMEAGVDLQALSSPASRSGQVTPRQATLSLKDLPDFGFPSTDIETTCGDNQDKDSDGVRSGDSTPSIRSSASSSQQSSGSPSPRRSQALRLKSALQALEKQSGALSPQAHDQARPPVFVNTGRDPTSDISSSQPAEDWVAQAQQLCERRRGKATTCPQEALDQTSGNLSPKRRWVRSRTNASARRMQTIETLPAIQEDDPRKEHASYRSNQSAATVASEASAGRQPSSPPGEKPVALGPRTRNFNFLAAQT